MKYFLLLMVAVTFLHAMEAEEDVNNSSPISASRSHQYVQLINVDTLQIRDIERLQHIPLVPIKTSFWCDTNFYWKLLALAGVGGVISLVSVMLKYPCECKCP